VIVGGSGGWQIHATLDLIYEVERRGLFAFFIPSVFTPLHDTRVEQKKGVTETAQPDAAAVAADDEVLEDEPATGSEQLVGTDRRAPRRHRPVGLEAPKAERPRLQVAVVELHPRAAQLVAQPL
jgi:hypothetical protein